MYVKLCKFDSFIIEKTLIINISIFYMYALIVRCVYTQSIDPQ